MQSTLGKHVTGWLGFSPPINTKPLKIGIFYMSGLKPRSPKLTALGFNLPDVKTVRPCVSPPFILLPSIWGGRGRSVGEGLVIGDYS
jgi:hypothetical protein